MTNQSRILKAEEAQEFQSWTTHLAALNEEFAPFFSLTAPAPNAPNSSSFKADEVQVLSQHQADNDNWQNFTVPGLNALSSDEVDGAAGGLSADDLMAQQQMAMMAEAAGGEFDLKPNAEDASSENGEETVFDDGFADAIPGSVTIPPVSDDEAFTEARERGFAEGFEAGMSDGLAQGIAKGESEAQAQVELILTQELEKLALTEHALGQVTNVLGDALFKPMQRLALHMAKELVRGELTVSDAAVTRLVKGCMERLDVTQGKLQVYMNDEDFQLLQEDSMLQGKIAYLPSSDLQPGSVRVEQADSWVDDLLEERLLMLSNQALGEVDNKLLAPVAHLADEEQEALFSAVSDADQATTTEALAESEAPAKTELEQEQDTESAEKQQQTRAAEDQQGLPEVASQVTESQPEIAAENIESPESDSSLLAPESRPEEPETVQDQVNIDAADDVIEPTDPVSDDEDEIF